MTKENLTLIYVGYDGCRNCTLFEPEWEGLEKMKREGKLRPKNLELRKFKVRGHAELPPSLQKTVSFYPFLLLLPTYYLENNLGGDSTLVGEALYAYKKIVDGNLEYKFCENVGDYPSMRYPRTAVGVLQWVTEIGLDAIATLAPRFYPEMSDTIIRQRNLAPSKAVDWNLEHDKFSKDMLIIPSLNREYRITPAGGVIIKRVKNTHF
jgi:hypothetical protein